MQIINLRDAPEHIPTLARWHFAEWGYLNPGQTLDDRITRLYRYLSDATLPSFLLALDEDKQLLATAALVESDMDNHPELSPWLASVYVREDLRGRGIGSVIVKALMAFARSADVGRIYLFTPNQADFYAKLDWQVYARESYRGTPVTLMYHED